MGPTGQLEHVIRTIYGLGQNISCIKQKLVFSLLYVGQNI